MARSKKYGEETRMFSTRVPASQFEHVGKLVRDFLESIKPDDAPIVEVKDVKQPETISFGCGCVLGGGLLRKPKGSPCRKTKDEHLES